MEIYSPNVERIKKEGVRRWQMCEGLKTREDSVELTVVSHCYHEESKLSDVTWPGEVGVECKEELGLIL